MDITFVLNLSGHNSKRNLFICHAKISTPLYAKKRLNTGGIAVASNSMGNWFELKLVHGGTADDFKTSMGNMAKYGFNIWNGD